MEQHKKKKHQGVEEEYPLTPEMTDLFHEVTARHEVRSLKEIVADAALPEAPLDSGSAPKDPVLIPITGPGGCAQKDPVLIPVYDSVAASQLANGLSEGAADQRDAIRPILKSMLRSDGRRRLVSIDDVSRVSALRERFPNFEEAIQLIEGAVALAARTPQRILHLPPLLLLSEPGVGKTTFSQAVAKALGTPMSKVSFAQASAGWILGGLDLSWRGGKPGRVFDLLVRGDVANPMILCDEIDKARGDSSHDPIGALYDLLERQSARAFEDESVPIPLDASHIVWVLTANDLRNIPDPILSRCEIVTVRRPTGAHAAQVAASIYASLRDSVAGASTFPPTLPELVIERLVELPPRDLMRTLVQCLRAAALRGGYELCPADLPMPRRKPRVGF